MKGNGRVKTTLEANAELMDLVRQAAQSMGISTAGMVDRLILEGLEQWAAGNLDFQDYLQPTSRGRYTWTVEINPNGLKEAIARKVNIT